MLKPVKRLYEDFLLNEWIKRERNQIKLVEYLFMKKKGFIFKEVQSIIDFDELEFDFNDPENEYTQFILKEEREKQEKSRHRILEKLYERKVKDYLMTAKAKDVFGLSFRLNILCEVRSRYLRSPYAIARIRDYGGCPMGLDESEKPKTAASVILTSSTNTESSLTDIRIHYEFYSIHVYEVSKPELDKIAQMALSSKPTR